MLVREYELFMMHDNENISDMFSRFTMIINSLKNLGKSYPNQELVRKIFRCLPRSWTPKVTTIEEAKDLSTLLLEQLLESSKKEEPTCYECKKSGHFKSDCPNIKKKEKFNKEQPKKKKSFVATWDDSDSSSSDEESGEEVANIAFMEIEEEEEDEVNFSFDELQEAYENLFDEFKNVCLKNKSLKKDVISMSKENENLKNENSNYINEIEILNVSLKF
ncbi:zf-CCHC domain-containing protein/UBN2 domain-containing protein [Cephalotus follicularis]|uniref:Zf-CCHC domain-containing protein/UBN2 domain-containing protein n=1 Tax=Cephalotus follicularis TaxID=3775 RepID=A0A1Q3CJ42_CEPFO|nr:zf-CCHC domain-containing protein/UBN2 domain-containing protein [Cephalotus follicularis]